MAANYDAKAGNFYKFASLASSATADHTFDKPVKRIICMDAVQICQKNVDTSTTPATVTYPVVATLVTNEKYEFPNDFGYPATLHLKNGGGSAVVPTFAVDEFGDVENENYFVVEV